MLSEKPRAWRAARVPTRIETGITATVIAVVTRGVQEEQVHQHHDPEGDGERDRHLLQCLAHEAW